MKTFRAGLRVTAIVTVTLVLIIVVGVPAYYALPLARCALAEEGQWRQGFSFHAIGSSGGKRCYLLYVPSTFRGGQPSPVVLSLHGFMSEPYDQQHYARWEDDAEAGGFLVVYPQGTSFPLRWNVGPGARIQDVDDVQFIEDVIVDLSSQVTVDQSRIFVTGFSNGGEKANQIGCALANKIAAIGVVAGLGPDYPGGCHPVRPLPVVAFIGTGERQSQPKGFSLWVQDLVFNVSLESALPGPANSQEWIQAWAHRDGCQADPVTRQVSPHVEEISYPGCAEDAQVKLYSIQGGGHAWPGGPAIVIPGFGKSTTEIDASAIMWSFFQAHPLVPSP